MQKNLKTFLVMAALPLAIISCKKDKNEQPQPITPPALEIRTVSNLFANDSTGHHTFFNLRTNAIVNLSDSASSNWDLWQMLLLWPYHLLSQLRIPYWHPPLRGQLHSYVCHALTA